MSCLVLILGDLALYLIASSGLRLDMFGLLGVFCTFDSAFAQ